MLQTLQKLSSVCLLSVLTSMSVAQTDAPAPQTEAQTKKVKAKTETIPSKEPTSQKPQATDASATKAKKITKDGYQQIQWIDLLPEDDLVALTGAPDMSGVAEGSSSDKISSNISMGITDPITAYEKALVSVKVKGEYDKRKVKIPGYVVPTETTQDGKVTEFFLVPFFGACIHLPPPPPNQIIFAQFEEGIVLDIIQDPYWVDATLFTQTQTNDLATAAYTAKVDKMYKFKPDDDY